MQKEGVSVHILLRDSVVLFVSEMLFKILFILWFSVNVLFCLWVGFLFVLVCLVFKYKIGHIA